MGYDSSKQYKVSLPSAKNKSLRQQSTGQLTNIIAQAWDLVKFISATMTQRNSFGSLGHYFYKSQEQFVQEIVLFSVSMESGEYEGHME